MTTINPTDAEFTELTYRLGGQIIPLVPGSSVTAEAVAHAPAMVTRYEQATATHPPAGAPLTPRQQVELDNLGHWRRRLNAITRAQQA